MTTRRALRRRKIDLDFRRPVARHWYRGDRFRTHWLNAYSLLVPEGEKFIHRTVAHFAGRVRDAELRAQLDDFSRQELGHAGQHLRSYQVLDHQGYRYRGLLAGYRWLTYSVLERLIGKRLSLSVAAGVEHFNSMFAEIGLERDDYFEGADSEMTRLMRWHFAEEIEHKAVVHDVLADVLPGYLRRVVGGLLGFVLFAVDMVVVSAWLAAQDGSLLRPSTWLAWFRYGFTRERLVSRMIRGALTYLRPRFHPDDHDNYALVDRVAVAPAPRSDEGLAAA